MAELIDRANLKADVERDQKDRSGMTDCAFKEGFACGLELALERIENAPVADAEPVVHARWVQDDTLKDLYFCSKCLTRDHRKPRHKFCPDCGARMDADAPERAGKEREDG